MPPPQKIFLFLSLKRRVFVHSGAIFAVELNKTGFVYKMREILMIQRVSGRWSPKCGSLPRDAGDLVGLDTPNVPHPVAASTSHVVRSLDSPDSASQTAS